MTAPLLLETLRLVESAHKSLQARPHAKDRFWTFRAYESGDPASLIDWRQSGRVNKLSLREREKEAPRTLALWSNLSPVSPEGQKLFPVLLALAALGAEQGAEILWLADPPLRLKTRHGLEKWAEEVLGLPDGARQTPPPCRVPLQSWSLMAGDFTGDLAIWQNWLRATGAESPLLFLDLLAAEKTPEPRPTACLAQAAKALLIENPAEKPMEALLKLFELLFSSPPRLSPTQGLW